MSEQPDRQLAVAHRLVEAGKALRVFQTKDQYYPNPATEQAMKASERAFGDEDYDRAEHLADVVLRMARRDTIKFRADRKAWIEKLRFVSGEVPTRKNDVPSWARGPWRRMLLFHRICELHDAEARSSMAGFCWSDDAWRAIDRWREDAKEWFETDELDKCEHACMQAEIEMTKAERHLHEDHEAR